MIPSNCGQVAKKFLNHLEKTENFSFQCKDKDVVNPIAVRRKLKPVSKKFSCVSIPKDPSVIKTKSLLNDRVESGEIDLGEEIVERSFSKFVTDKSGDVKTKTFSVFGRKHPLSVLRKKLFLKHEKYMKLNTNDLKSIKFVIIFR